MKVALDILVICVGAAAAAAYHPYCNDGIFPHSFNPRPYTVVDTRLVNEHTQQLTLAPPTKVWNIVVPTFPSCADSKPIAKSVNACEESRSFEPTVRATNLTTVTITRADDDPLTTKLNVHAIIYCEYNKQLRTVVATAVL